MISEITEDTYVRFEGSGSHVYSPPRNNQSKGHLVKIKNKKLIVAFTSSPDEVSGGRESNATLGVVNPPWQFTFGETPDSFHSKWLQSVCQYISNRSDVEFIIRVHPREGKNKRENNSSEHLQRLQENLSNLPKNCSIIWPETKVSSYDLGERADVILVSWSTIGLEMAKLGMPVLCSSLGVSGVVNDDFQMFFKNQADYFKRLEEMLKEPPNFQRLKHAYRWWHLFCIANSIDLSDLIPSSEYCDLPEFRMPKNHDDLIKVICTNESVFEINKKNLLKIKNNNSEKDESLELKKQCRKLVFYLITNKRLINDFELCFIQLSKNDKYLPSKTYKLKNKSSKAFVFERDGLVHFCFNGKIVKKYSPMIAKLGFLGAHKLFIQNDWTKHTPPFSSQISKNQAKRIVGSILN